MKYLFKLASAPLSPQRVRDLVLMAALVASFASCLLQNQVMAACSWDAAIDDLNANGCLKDNYTSLPQEIKSELSFSEYMKRAQACDALNQNGGGECANATSSCLLTVVNAKDACDAELIGKIQDECLGSIFGSSDKILQPGVDSCDPIAAKNADALSTLEKSLSGKVMDNCSGKDDPDQRAACAATVRQAKIECGKANGIKVNDQGRAEPDADFGKDDGNNSFYVKPFDLDNYQKCLDKQVRDNTKDPKVCEAADGIFIDKDTQDPDTSLPDDKRNKLSKGCYYQASDLTNPEACEAGAKATGRDFKWQKTNKAGEKEAWGCVDPSNPDGKDNDKDNPDAVCLKAADGKTCITGSLEGGTKQCGQASTNIIGCGSDQGATALNNVLRIFVIVLTFGIGIAATGSIAYSAIRYAGARDNQSDVSLARERIRNVVIGLLLYGFLIAIANWLVPGGIF